MDQEDKIRKEIEQLKAKHKVIEDRLRSLEGKVSSINEQFTLKKLKKEKLSIKERIIFLEGMLYDDIIA